VFAPKMNEFMLKIKKENKGKLLSSFSLTLTFSAAIALIGMLSNIVFLPLFGSFSTVSVFTNIIFGPLLTVYLCLSTVLVLLIPLPSLARLLAYPTAKFGELLLIGINKAANYKYSVISLKHGYSEEACIIFFAVMAVLLVIKIKRKRLLIVPVSAFLAFIAVGACLFSTSTENAYVKNLKDSQSEVFTVSCGDSFSIIDATNGRYSHLSEAARVAKDSGACEFESLVLTHYHRYHISSVRRFLQKEIVRCLIIPIPQNEYDSEIFTNLTEMLASLNVPYTLYSNDSATEIADNVYISAFPIERIKRSTHALISFSLYFGEEVFTYIGSSVNDGTGYASVDKMAARSETVLLGRHGPIQKTYPIYTFSDKAGVYINDSLIFRFYSSCPENANVNADIIFDDDGLIEFCMDGKNDVDKKRYS